MMIVWKSELFTRRKECEFYMKKIIFLLMIFLLIGSWYFVIANGAQRHEDYNRYIDTANQYLDKEIYVDAIECYKRAIEIYPDIMENKLYLANIYKRAKMYNSFESYCMKLYGEHKENEEIICLLGEYYTENGKDEKAVAIYKSYLSENKESQIISQKLNELKSAFTVEYKTYSYISTFRNGYAIFKKADKYGIMDNRGNEITKAVYDFAGIYTKFGSLKLAPVLSDNEYYYIDSDGNKRLALDMEYDYLGSFSQSGKAVYKRDNLYGYLDKKLNENENKYDHASSFYEHGIAAVKKDNKWFLIDESLEKINDKQYDDIKIDDIDCAVHSDIIFAKQDNKYMMIDINGREITKPLFDDVDFFAGLNEYAAVKIEDKWGFVNYEGSIIIEPKYDNAFSFSCGLAPVLIEDKWGYIDINDNLVISPQFNMAKSFNSSGYAPVLKSEWQILKLKYYEKGAIR